MVKFRDETRRRIAHEPHYAKKRGVSDEKAREMAREDAPERKFYTQRLRLGERPK